MSRDILRIEKNASGGRDLIIGDVHGGAAAFKAVLGMLRPNDRLFLVGDLVDRGEDSAAIIRLILEKNFDKTPPIVYAVKGNHEEMFLDAMAHLKSPTKYSHLLFFDFLRNGGEWIYSDQSMRDEIKAILASRDPNDTKKWSVLELHNAERESKGSKVFIPNLKEIWVYIKSLPYIILAGTTSDPDAFVVCHADRPRTLSDSVLNARFKLTNDEIKHITWARPAGSGEG